MSDYEGFQNGEEKIEDRKGVNVLSKYLQSSASMFGQERNRFTFLLIGAGLLFICVSYPLARAFFPEVRFWIIQIPGMIVICIAFCIALIDRRRTPYRPIKCLSGLPEELRPCKEIEACWAERQRADDDLTGAILKCQNRLFLAGACLNTLQKVLVTHQVVEYLAQQLSLKEEFRIIILVVRSPGEYPSYEKGRECLPVNIASGHKLLGRFQQELRSRLPEHFSRDPVEFRTYDEHVWPRHFIMEADAHLYAGSYLCHEEGAFSYLFRLTSKGVDKGLYTLFKHEIEYLEVHSVPFDLTSPEGKGE